VCSILQSHQPLNGRKGGIKKVHGYYTQIQYEKTPAKKQAKSKYNEPKPMHFVYVINMKPNWRILNVYVLELLINREIN